MMKIFAYFSKICTWAKNLVTLRKNHEDATVSVARFFACGRLSVGYGELRSEFKSNQANCQRLRVRRTLHHFNEENTKLSVFKSCNVLRIRSSLERGLTMQHLWI